MKFFPEWWFIIPYDSWFDNWLEFYFEPLARFSLLSSFCSFCRLASLFYLIKLKPTTLFILFPSSIVNENCLLAYLLFFSLSLLELRFYSGWSLSGWFFCSSSALEISPSIIYLPGKKLHRMFSFIRWF